MRHRGRAGASALVTRCDGGCLKNRAAVLRQLPALLLPILCHVFLKRTRVRQEAPVERHVRLHAVLALHLRAGAQVAGSRQRTR